MRIFFGDWRPRYTGTYDDTTLTGWEHFWSQDQQWKTYIHKTDKIVTYLHNNHTFLHDIQMLTLSLKSMSELLPNIVGDLWPGDLCRLLLIWNSFQKKIFEKNLYKRNLCILHERLTNEKIEWGKVGGDVRNRFFGAVSTVYRLDSKTLATL